MEEAEERLRETPVHAKDTSDDESETFVTDDENS